MSVGYKHLFFDLDGTVTPSRSLIEPEMEMVMNGLLQDGMDVVIVSGADVQQARFQCKDLPFIYLGQNGNHAYDGKEKKDLWRELLTQEEKDEVYVHIASIPRTWEVENMDDLVEDRNSQISYSLLGHHADEEKKKVFDAHGELRQSILAQYPFVSKTMEVVIGGTTCFDYIKRGYHKGRNVLKLIAERGWEKDACMYFGDALYKGGNDESVLGVIKAQPVESPNDTALYLKELQGVRLASRN